MEVSTEELNTMQSQYKAAVDAWVSAIREEEALASKNHDEAELDRWELAASKQEAAKKTADAAKQKYEAGLRERFFAF